MVPKSSNLGELIALGSTRDPPRFGLHFEVQNRHRHRHGVSGSGYLAVLLMIRAGGTPEGITI